MQDLYAVWFARLYECCQPKLDIHARRGEVFAASAKSSPKAAVQQAVADLADAASGTSDREVQRVTFAKSPKRPIATVDLSTSNGSFHHSNDL